MADAEAALRGLVAFEPASVGNKIALVGSSRVSAASIPPRPELTGMLAASPDDGPLRLAAGQFYESRSLPGTPSACIAPSIGMASGSRLVGAGRLAAMRVRENRAAEARPLIDEVLEQNPRDNDALVLRASLALAEGRTLEAITDLRSVLRDQPESSALLRTLAYAHAQNNEPDLARENYRRAIEVDPANTRIRLEYAEYLSRRGENAEAKPLLDAVLNAEPQNVAALEIQFRVLAALGDTAAAAGVAREIIGTHPEAALGYYLEGLAQESTGDRDAAAASYELALAKEPRGAEPIGALSRLFVTAGRRDEARARLEEVVATYPDHAVALNLLAEISLADR
jgi:Tfp pilus assembly protein PilF